MPALLIVAMGSASGAPVSPWVEVLGIAQDAGHPHIGCTAELCTEAFADPARGHHVVSLAIVDPAAQSWWLLDASPDLPAQLHAIGSRVSGSLGGIFVTHAHIGHYTGLMYLGREAQGASGVPVWAMPRMAAFLRENGPWSQLVTAGNIAVTELADGTAVSLGQVAVTPFRVPHRDEFSETVGFRVRGPKRTVVYLPDIDKWERWDEPVEQLVAGADVLWLDGTFYANGEVARDMSEIPHPFVSETVARLEGLPASERDKVRFIHLNHTNPLLDPASAATRAVRAAGMHVAAEGEKFEL